MHIPKYWAKESRELNYENGGPFLAQCWGWSDRNEEEARDRAKASIRDIARTIRNKEKPGRYFYGERPLREEIVKSIPDGSDEPVAVITRNGYGALILNTARVMFVDIDFKPEGLIEKLTASVRRLLQRQAYKTQEEFHIQQLNHWMEAHPWWGMRVYRTKAGLRCLITHDTFDPSHKSSIKALESLGADPLYVKLCKDQESYRARITPKPWRCGLPKPPNKYPWGSENEEQKYRSWEARYKKVSSGYTTCKLIAEIHQERQHPEVSIIQDLHDRYACINDEFRMA